MKLYTYWRSLATFRVRIALNLKGLTVEPIYVDLDSGQQRQAEFKAVNPQMVIPALVEDDGNVLYQSMAIMEYLNEIHPEPMRSCNDQNGSSISVSVIADVVRKRSNGMRSTSAAEATAAANASTRGRGAPRSTHARSAMENSGAT